MCYFIEFAIPKAFAAATEAGAQGEMHVEKNINSKLAPLLPPNYATFSLVEAMCSCNLYTGRPSSQGALEKEKVKLQKKGWSEPKIERALAGRTLNYTKPFRDDAQSFLERLALEVHSLYLVVTWTDDDVGDAIEEVPVNTFADAHVQPRRIVRLTT